MTPDTQAPTAAPDGFIRYDGLMGIESPYEDFDDDFTQLRACQITLDRGSSTATWHVDGRKVYEAHGTLIPERARIGFGIYTMLSIRDGRSRSLNGQGMQARWRSFRVRGVDA